jgi:uncharacterized protein with von Willebrand factor type A (vWA) domain
MNTLKTILGTTCHFFMIIELEGSMKEHVVSAENLTEAVLMAKALTYRFYLIEPYEHGLPIVEEMNTEAANLGLPHTLRIQAA